LLNVGASGYTGEKVGHEPEPGVCSRELGRTPPCTAAFNVVVWSISVTIATQQGYKTRFIGCSQ
jgi:hypothetical protein